MTQTLLELVTRGLSEGLHDWISEKHEDARDRERLVQKIIPLLKESGYKNWERTWGTEDWHGNLVTYPVTFRYDFTHMTDPFPHGLVALPIYITDKGLDHRSVELVLVDINHRKVHRVFQSGDSGIHYEGTLQVRPHLVATDERRSHNPLVADVVYETERFPSGEEYHTLEPYARLLTKGTTAEREIHLTEVPLSTEVQVGRR